MITAIIQARMGSSRLPGKSLRIIAGKPLLQHVVERVEFCVGAGNVIVATTDKPDDEPIIKWCQQFGYRYLAWNRLLPNGKNDVLGRFRHAAQLSEDQVFMRVTGDCPLWCPILGREVVEAFQKHAVNICSNVHLAVDGFDTEVFTRAALIGADRMADLDYDREHVTPFLYKRTSQYYVNHVGKVGGLKLSVDTEEDFERVKTVLEIVKNYSWSETMQFC